MRVVLLLLVALAAGCIAPAAVDTASDPPVAGVDADGFAPAVFGDGFVFQTLDAVVDATLTMHAEVYLPDASKALAGAPEKVPTILVLSPYFGAGQGGEAPGHPVYKWLVERLVPRGYAVALGDTAGMGGSSGCWDFMGPDEVRGAAALVEAIARQPWSDGSVGMIGKSYDGMTQVMAASRNPEALKTIVPVAPLTHAYAGLFQNGIHYGGGWHLTTTAYHQISLDPPVGAEERYPGYATHAALTPTCAGQNTVLGNDPTGSYNAYFAERDFRPSAKDVKASVFYVEGFLDAAVKPDNLMGWWTDLPGPKKAWLGQWGHDYPNATFAGREDLYVTLHRWFDHELKGIDNGILDEPVVDVQDSLGRWRHESVWPPADATPLVLAPSADGRLGEGAGEGSATIGGPEATLGVLQEARAGAAEFEGEPLAAPLHVSGVARVETTVASDRPGGHLVARLFDANGTTLRQIAQGAINLQLAGGLASPQPLTPGAPVQVAFDLYPADYVVEAGHSLVLRLQTNDEAMWYDPDPWAATLTVALDKTTVTLPTIERAGSEVFLVACGIRISEQVPSCFEEGRIDLDREDVA
ncbi:MAG TPA: CocE/NonD family hydrolase [Candidatus Thermoplasmatota archaeon]|nr:CocE/NonD family hydrolase [Candidatus Thermoplasmatota archaeon]